MSAQAIPLLDFQNVVANGVAVTDLSHLFGYTIRRLVLQLGGTSLTKAMLTAVQLKANGKVIFDSTGSRIDSRMQYRGITANAAFLSIDFTELKARSKLAMLGGAMDTLLGIKTLRLEVTIAGATAPTLQGYAEVTLPQAGPEYVNLRPLIARVHNFSQVIGAAGTFPLLVPHFDPNGGGSIFKRIVVFSANMTAAQLKRNGIEEFNLTKARNDFYQTEYGRTSQANVFVIDPVVDGLQEDRVFDTRPAAKVNTAQIFGTFSAGETINIEAEVLEPLDAY